MPNYEMYEEPSASDDHSADEAETKTHNKTQKHKQQHSNGTSPPATQQNKRQRISAHDENDESVVAVTPHPSNSNRSTAAQSQQQQTTSPRRFNESKTESHQSNTNTNTKSTQASSSASCPPQSQNSNIVVKVPSRALPPHAHHTTTVKVTEENHSSHSLPPTQATIDPHSDDDHKPNDADVNHISTNNVSPPVAADAQNTQRHVSRLKRKYDQLARLVSTLDEEVSAMERKNKDKIQDVDLEKDEQMHSKQAKQVQHDAEMMHVGHASIKHDDAFDKNDILSRAIAQLTYYKKTLTHLRTDKGKQINVETEAKTTTDSSNAESIHESSSVKSEPQQQNDEDGDKQMILASLDSALVGKYDEMYQAEDDDEAENDYLLSNNPILDVLPVCTTSLNGTLIDANQEFANCFGYKNRLEVLNPNSVLNQGRLATLYRLIPPFQYDLLTSILSPLNRRLQKIETDRFLFKTPKKDIRYCHFVALCEFAAAIECSMRIACALLAIECEFSFVFHLADTFLLFSLDSLLCVACVSQRFPAARFLCQSLVV